MILRPIASHLLPRALGSFAAALADEPARRIFRRIAVPAQARRASAAAAVAHHRQALALASGFGMGLRCRPPAAGFAWDGRALATATEAYVLLHEIAHYQLAAPTRRRCAEFGLGAGPETGDRDSAERRASRFGIAREREEAMASLLGILWEAALGQPALASFLDQNWLDGAAPAGHFAAILARLEAGGFLAPNGDPRRRLRQVPDAPDGQ